MRCGLRVFLCCLLGSSVLARADVHVVPDDFDTVQAALDAAKPGDEVKVKPGEYTESLTLPCGVTLTGEGDGEVIVQCAPEAGSVLTVADCAEGTVKHITFRHTPESAGAETNEKPPPACRISRSGITFASCTVRDAAAHGLVVDGAGQPTILESTFEENAFDGILVMGNGADVTLVANSSIRNKRYGIWICNGAHVEARENASSENQLSGIVVNGEKTAATLIANTCRENSKHGIWICQGAQVEARENTCDGNKSSGLIVEGKTTRATLIANSARDNTYAGVFFGSGVQYEARDNVFVHNKQITEGELLRLFSSGRFAELETIAARLREEKARYVTGEWQLGYFYSYLGNECKRIGAQEEQVFTKRIGTWDAQSPGSITWRLVWAQAYVDLAWRERGSGWSRTVTEEGWEGFHRYLSKAWALIEEARELPTKDPHLYALCINLAKMHDPGESSGASILAGLARRIAGWTGDSGADKPDLGGFIEAGFELEPLYFPMYRKKATTLLPRWGGRRGALEQFAADAADRTQELGGDTLYAVVAASAQRVGAATYLHRFRFSWPRIKKGCQAILAKYPDSFYWPNIYCLLACLHEDRETAKALFDTIGGNVDLGVWGRGARLQSGEKKYRVNQWRAWARGEAERDFVASMEYAVAFGDDVLLRSLLEEGNDPSQLTDYGEPMICLALDNNELGIAKILAAAGADLDQRVPTGFPALVIAMRGALDIRYARLLLEEGAKPDTQQNNGETALFYAIRWNQYEKFALLLESGADHSITKEGGFTPLILAAYLGRPAMITELLAHGAQVDGQDEGGRTALCWAAVKDRREAARKLIEAGADVNARTNDGTSPLKAAKDKGALRTFTLLQDKGAEF